MRRLVDVMVSIGLVLALVALSPWLPELVLALASCKGGPEGGADSPPAASSSVFSSSCRTVAFGPGEARFTCNRLGSLGTRPRLSSNRADRAQKAAELQAPVRPDGRVAMAEGGTP